MFNEVFLIKQLVWFNKRPKFLFWALFVVLLSCNAPASSNQNYDDYKNNDTTVTVLQGNASGDGGWPQIPDSIKSKGKRIYLIPHIDTLGDGHFKGLFKKGK